MNPEEIAERQQARPRWIIIALIGLGVALVVFAIVLSQSPSGDEVATAAPGALPNPDGNSLGDPDAPIRIEEFSDFQCPYCQLFHEETEPLLVEQYVSTGKVHFTYRSMGNFVSDNISQAMDTRTTESRDAALAAYCAGDQNRFWEMQAALFANVLGEDAGSFTDRRIRRIAEKAGLDLEQFDRCYGSDKYVDRVQQDFQDAQAAGIVGVPSFVLTYTVNGETQTRLIEGAQPFSAFQEELDAILNEIGAH